VDLADEATPKATRASFQKLDFAEKLLLGGREVLDSAQRASFSALFATSAEAIGWFRRTACPWR
jgi:hypothetical protein